MCAAEGLEFIDVSFEHGVYATKVEVYLNFNPGSLVKISSWEEVHVVFFSRITDVFFLILFVGRRNLAGYL